LFGWQSPLVVARAALAAGKTLLGRYASMFLLARSFVASGRASLLGLGHVEPEVRCCVRRGFSRQATRLLCSQPAVARSGLFAAAAASPDSHSP
jgi:hypothetical protein